MTETPNLGLSQWSLDDLIKMADFNSDNLKLDNFGRLNSGLGNEYVWAKTKVEPEFGSMQEVVMCSGSDDVRSVYLYYADSISEDGTLVNPTQASVYTSGDNYQNANLVKGKYWKSETYTAVGAEGVFYTPLDAPDAVFAPYQVSIQAQKYNGSTETSFGYINDSNPNAYPVDDEFTYTPLGQIGNKARIATGKYVGTGGVGVSNAKRLTFDFKPAIVFVFYSRISTVNGYDQGNGVGTYIFNPYGLGYGTGTGGYTSYGYYYSGASSDASNQKARFDDETNTLNWYADTAGAHANEASCEYHYIALG